MRTLSLALIAAASLAFAGCKKKPGADELTKVKNAACACADKACAQKIFDQMDKLLGSVEESDLDDKTTAIVMDAATCLARLGVY